MKKKEFRKKFWPTSNMQRNLVCFLSKPFRLCTARENCIIRVHVNIFQTKIFEKFNSFFRNFGTLNGFFPAFLQTIFARVVETATFKSRGTVWGIERFKINFKIFIFFRQWAKKFWLSGKFFYGYVFITAYYVSVAGFWGKTTENLGFFIILGLWTEFFWPYVNFFGRGSPNCNLIVPRNTLVKIKFFK